jgi:hypothetical protein
VLTGEVILCYFRTLELKKVDAVVTYCEPVLIGKLRLHCRRCCELNALAPLRRYSWNFRNRRDRVEKSVVKAIALAKARKL